MEVKTDYQQIRVKNRRDYLDSRRKERARHVRSVERVLAKCDEVGEAVDFFVRNESSIKRALNSFIYYGQLLKMSKSISPSDMLKFAEEALEDIRIGKGDYLLPNVREILQNFDFDTDDAIQFARYNVRRTKKDIIANFNKSRREFISYFAGVENLVISLSKAFDGEFFDSKSFFNSIRDIKSTHPEKETIDDLFKESKKILQEELLSEVERCRSKIRSYKPLIKDDKKEFAKSNVGLLEKEVCKIKSERVKYFESLDGDILAYCTYALEARNQEDKTYREFLNQKADGRLLILREKGVNIVDYLEGLNEKGFISEEEFFYIRKLNVQEQTKDESEDDLLLRAAVIEDYGISREDSKWIAGMVDNDNLDRTERKLKDGIGEDLVKIIFRNNPKLFLMSEKQSERFVSKFKELENLTRKYGVSDNFNPIKSPVSFSSLNVLDETRRIIERRQRVYDNRSSVNLTEVDAIKSQLSNEGFDAEMTWAILQRGFYYGRAYFVGSHRLGYENLEYNTAKGFKDSFNKRLFAQQLRKLISSGIVLDNRGYSLNPRTKEMPDSLRIAVSYVLAHH